MACNICRRRLLSVFVPEFSSISHQQLPRRNVRAFTSSRVRRHQPSQKLNNSLTESTSTSNQDDLTIPFLSTANPSNDANVVKQFPERRHETAFEPRLQLKLDPTHDKAYAESEQDSAAVPKLGKNARKKIRRKALEAQIEVPGQHSESASRPTFAKASRDPKKVSAKSQTTSTPRTRRQQITTSGKGSAPNSKKEPKMPKAPNPMKTREPWQVQKKALKEKFGEQEWTPMKKLSPDAMDGIRALHTQYPQQFTTPVLAKHFKISAEAIRRILKSKWQPNPEEDEARRDRWERRGLKIWSRRAEAGVNPPSKWKVMGAGRGLPRESIERGEAGRQAKREEYSSDAERRLKQLMAEIPDLR